MDFFKRLFRKPAPQPSASDADHAVLLHLPYPGDGLPPGHVVEQMHALQDELDTAITNAGVGELDGDEFGDGECVVFMYGQDADALWSAVDRVLKQKRFMAGAKAVKRYGQPGAREEVILLAIDSQEDAR
ncbi:MAG: hypothetical protein EA376_11260 [Phycisphaeraceae bacterium]|nr:MAG: hypothetical protein EA376_11260 [Phycisphaeraceae bacterium]